MVSQPTYSWLDVTYNAVNSEQPEFENDYWRVDALEREELIHCRLVKAWWNRKGSLFMNIRSFQSTRIVPNPKRKDIQRCDELMYFYFSISLAKCLPASLKLFHATALLSESAKQSFSLVKRRGWKIELWLSTYILEIKRLVDVSVRCEAISDSSLLSEHFENNGESGSWVKNMCHLLSLCAFIRLWAKEKFFISMMTV
jgi:hypothetical protein